MNQQQPIKRKNPFELKFEQEQEEIKAKEQEVEEEVEYEEDYEPEVVVQKPVAPKKTQKVVQRQTYVREEIVDRQKYTSTMDVALRRRIKVFCAQRGIMFAKFVEDACREKLNKEGNR